MRKLLNIKAFFYFFFILVFATSVAAENSIENTLYQDKTKIVSQQIDLLKNRLVQFQNEIAKLKSNHNNALIPSEEVTKQTQNQAGLDIAVAKSNLDSINIETTECEQSINRLDNDIQEITNQLNAYNIFSLRNDNNNGSNLKSLQAEAAYQKNLLKLEKVRLEYLQKLQSLAKSSLQIYKDKFKQIEATLKSKKMLELKALQAKSEIRFQAEQSYWLREQNRLYNQLNELSHSKNSRAAYIKLENDIFYANENVNFTYLQMLIARYQDQIRQLKISITHTSSITALDKVSEQARLLGKQLERMTNLLNTRANILLKRKNILLQTKEVTSTYKIGLSNLYDQYTNALKTVDTINQQLTIFRESLDKALQQELSSRQGFPGLGAKAWADLGAEILLVPSLIFEVTKSLACNMLKALQTISISGWGLLIVLEILWVFGFKLLYNFLRKIISGVPDHEYGHINLKWLIIKLSSRNLINIAVIGNMAGIFYFCHIPAQSFNFLINLALVWLFFKIILIAARLCLVETVHDRAGHDVRLYHRLKWTFLAGGIITALTVFIHQLPLVYEVKDLFDRLFLVVLFIASIFLIKSWEVLPALILPHVDDRHTYVKRVVRLLCLLIPMILLANSIIGILGYVNLVQTIFWYESVFLLVLVGYLFVRGLLNDSLDFLSQVLIRHTVNGWLLTESFLKPLDKILRLVLFLCAGALLFRFYNWDRQSSVVIGLTKLLNYHLVDMLNTSITLFSLIELSIIVSFLFWAAKWSREFVYRFLLSRTKDLGVRNSIAILSQYSIIVIGVFICLRVLGIDFRALTFVASFFALGVGLGLRDLVNNFACGFLLLIERPLRVGDTVTINNYEGEVTNIGSRAVTIRTWDHMEVLVPNTEIFSKTFLNWTAKDHIVRTVANIKINRHDKPQEVQALIHKVLAEHKAVLKDPVPEVFLSDLSDGLTLFEVRYFINLRLVKSRIAIRSEVLVAIWEAFELHGIKPPYPHHEIHLQGAVMPILESIKV